MYYCLAFAALLVVPTHIAFAAARTFKELVSQLVGLIDLATIALFSVAILFFFWTVVTQLWGYDSGNAEQKQKLQQSLFWGVITIFIMVSIWGIISVLQQTLSRGLG